MYWISPYWNPAFVPALAALFGSIVGASGSASSAWIAQRHQSRRELLTKQIFYREQLYSDFISEGAKVLVDAAQHTFKDPSRVIELYALRSRIRLSSPMNVVEAAERVVRHALDAYAGPNLTPEEIQTKAEKEDPLRDFSEVCRRDLQSLWSAL